MALSRHSWHPDLLRAPHLTSRASTSLPGSAQGSATGATSAAPSPERDTRFPSFSWPSRLCSHEGEVVGEELSGHWIDKASKVACLGRLGGEHLREFADGGFHGASDPP